MAQAPADPGSGQWKNLGCGRQAPKVEDIAVLGNRIAAVGSTQEIRKWVGANTKVIDLQGRRVTPRFNDSHVHFFDSGMGLASLQLHDARIPEEFRDRSSISLRRCPKANGYDHFPGICEMSQAIIAMKTNARNEMINTTHPGIRLFDSVSTASARTSRASAILQSRSAYYPRGGSAAASGAAASVATTVSNITDGPSSEAMTLNPTESVTT